jgi:hypothetical protein
VEVIAELHRKRANRLRKALDDAENWLSEWHDGREKKCPRCAATVRARAAKERDDADQGRIARALRRAKLIRSRKDQQT